MLGTLGGGRGGKVAPPQMLAPAPANALTSASVFASISGSIPRPEETASFSSSSAPSSSIQKAMSAWMLQSAPPARSTCASCGKQGATQLASCCSDSAATAATAAAADYVIYCNRQCQRQHWKEHQKDCTRCKPKATLQPCSSQKPPASPATSSVDVPTPAMAPPPSAWTEAGVDLGAAAAADAPDTPTTDTTAAQSVASETTASTSGHAKLLSPQTSHNCAGETSGICTEACAGATVEHEPTLRLGCACMNQSGGEVKAHLMCKIKEAMVAADKGKKLV